MNEPTARGPNDPPVERVDRRKGSVIVRLAGELDLYTAPAVRKTLLTLAAEQPERLVIDLEDVEFIDSTALGVLIEARATLTNRSAFRLAAPGVETHRALEISGLDRHLAVHESVGAALDAPLT
jgi:anti-sigma B factor antagonist